MALVRRVDEAVDGVTTDDDVRHVENLVHEPVFASVPADDQVAAAEWLGAAPIDAAPDSSAVA